MSDFLKNFLFIFFAALPGKTTFLLVLLSAKSKSRNIILGAGAAFFLQCLISVALGQFLKLIPQVYVDAATGLLFIYFGAQFWRESTQIHEGSSGRDQVSVKTVFAIIFLAELGDVSQLAIARVAASSPLILITFVDAVLALWLITILAVGAGRSLVRFVSQANLQKAGAVLFLAAGFYLCVQAFRHFMFSISTS